MAERKRKKSGADALNPTTEFGKAFVKNLREDPACNALMEQGIFMGIIKQAIDHKETEEEQTEWVS